MAVSGLGFLCSTTAWPAHQSELVRRAPAHASAQVAPPLAPAPVSTVVPQLTAAGLSSGSARAGPCHPATWRGPEGQRVLCGDEPWGGDELATSPDPRRFWGTLFCSLGRSGSCWGGRVLGPELVQSGH